MPAATLSVRTRLTLWHVGVMGVLLAAFAIGIYSFVRESLFAQIDTRIDESLAILEATVRNDIGDLSEIELHTRILAFRVLEGDWPLYASGGWIAGDLDAAGRPPESGRWIYPSRRGGIYHIREVPLRVGDRELRIATAEQGEQMHRGLDRLGWTILGGLPIALVLSLAGGYLLAGRALHPVQLLTSRARAISADNLSERLSVPNPHDELGQLTAVLNDAFTRLEGSFAQLKGFTHDAAHELRTPLSVLRSVGEVGLQQPSDADGYRDVIGSMLEEVDRLGRLVDGLLTLARAESGRFVPDLRPENLSDLIRSVVDCLQVLAEEKNQSLVFEAIDEPSTLLDRDTMRLALINVIANAIRYTQAGGEIRVSLRGAAGAQTVIDVADNGPGIAPEHRDRIFDRFYRIDDSRAQHTSGSGLGLAIARWAVEANGGTIELESGPRQGSRFRIVLPAT